VRAGRSRVGGALSGSGSCLDFIDGFDHFGETKELARFVGAENEDYFLGGSERLV